VTNMVQMYQLGIIICCTCWTFFIIYKSGLLATLMVAAATTLRVRILAGKWMSSRSINKTALKTGSWGSRSGSQGSGSWGSGSGSWGSGSGSWGSGSGSWGSESGSHGSRPGSWGFEYGSQGNNSEVFDWRRHFHFSFNSLCVKRISSGQERTVTPWNWKKKLKIESDGSGLGYKQCCGSGMFIPDPGSDLSCHPGSRIPDPTEKKRAKK
jgi:hypothetical protein